MLYANEFFEIIGELYYGRYHRLRPGKSVPMACGYDSSSEENRRQFNEWADGPLALSDAIERIASLQDNARSADALEEEFERKDARIAALEAELTGYKDSHDKYCPGTALERTLKAGYDIQTRQRDRIIVLEAALLRHGHKDGSCGLCASLETAAKHGPDCGYPFSTCGCPTAKTAASK